MSQNTKKRKEMKEMNEEVINIEGNHQSGTTICKGVMRYHREYRPAHYMLQIQSYSTLAVCKLERYESDVFQASGHKWRMILYLNGKSEVKEGSHISMYLAIADEHNELPVNREVWAHFKFFIYDQINDKYMVIQDAHNQLKRFNSDKTECGFDELILLDVFKDVNNGYLINDCCAFGVEVFVAKCSAKRESVSTLLKPPEYGTYTWKLNNFTSCLCYDSESFTVGGKKWMLRVLREGAKGCYSKEFLSIFLVLDEPEMLEKRCYAEFTLGLKNQSSAFRNMTVNGEKWFSESDKAWGIEDFIRLKDLNDTTKGYYVNDTIIVECQISFISEAELLEE